MPARVSFDYAVIRVVPRVDREERLNVGALLYCLTRDFLEARVELDASRLHALDAELDVEMVRAHLDNIPRLAAGDPAAGPIARLSQKERFHWLTAPRSTIIQLSPVHSGLCESPEAALEHLMAQAVRLPRQST